AGLSIVAIPFASFGRSRIVRAILASILLVVLFCIVAGMMMFTSFRIGQPEELRNSGFLLGLGIFASFVILATARAFAVGCARLAHEHENRSTLLRVIITLISLVMLGWGIY